MFGFWALVGNHKASRDTNIFYSNNNLRAPFETANRAQSQINDWFLSNELFLNVEKTKYMFFYKLTDQKNMPLKLSLLQLNCNIIEIEKPLKFLGVILDEHLTVKKNIKLIENKVSKMLVFFIKQVNK